MKYNIIKDIKYLTLLRDYSASELANRLGVARSTVSRIIKGSVYPNNTFLESFYSYAYEDKVKLNALKCQFAIDNYEKILFHGARGTINGPIDLSHSRNNIDIGIGFYLSEGYEQASSYINAYNDSSVYIFDVRKLSDLRIKEYSVSLEWMLIVCYYRGQLDKYEQSTIVRNIIEELEQYDVIIAPIADNDMYDIMTRFVRGDITDKQAISSLSASDLGKQHVLKSQKACNSIIMVDRLYISKPERKDIDARNKDKALISADKAKIAIEENRRNGKYIEELL